MGGAVSTGVDNDDLVDNLKAASYISTPLLERVFRAVDRGDYFTAENREQAYRDSAWKKGNLHLSAPCIYAKVMEGLQLAPGHSFLNLGSGTGYLSTMAGLIIGPYGVNHGVELHADVIQYATDRLAHFKSTSPAVDAFPFCEPSFVQGNCLCLPPDVRLYDRVYCGASCPESHEQYMKSLIKPGGILVMPLNDQLVRMTRSGLDSWETTPLLPVSFSSLVMPDPSHPPPIVILPNVELLDLQDLCRQQVRSILREAVETEHPELTTASNRPVQPRPKPRERRHFRSVIVPYVPGPFYESEDEDEDEGDAGLGERGLGRPGPRYYPRGRAANQISAFLELARNLASQSREEEEEEEGEGRNRRSRRDNWDEEEEEVEEEEEGEHDDAEVDLDVDADPEANVEKDGEDAGAKGQRRSLEEDSKEEDGAKEKKEGEEVPTSSSLSSNKKLKDKDTKEEKMEEGEVETAVVDSIPLPSSSTSVPHSDPIPVTFAISSPCSTKPQANKNNKKREKFDSGVGDEIENGKGPSSGGSEDDDGGMEVDSDRDTESDSDYSDNSAPRTKVTRYLDEDDPNCLCGENCAKAFRARRKKIGKDESGEMKEDDNGEDGGKEDGEGGGGRDSTSSVEILSAIETYMREKINLLPLPQALKLYLNYNREL